MEVVKAGKVLGVDPSPPLDDKSKIILAGIYKREVSTAKEYAKKLSETLKDLVIQFDTFVK